MTPELAIWLLIGLTSIADAILLAAQGMTITSRWPTVIFIALLCGFAALIRRRNPGAARVASATAQVWAFAMAGGVLSYAAMAASPFPMADDAFAHWDSAIGFDWLAWYGFVQGHPLVHALLAAAYASIPVQAAVLILWFCYARRDRVDELLMAASLPVVLIMPIMVLLPALGPWSEYGVRDAPWGADILALRAHGLPVIGQTIGIITFPSYHVILGVALAYCARGSKLFLPLLVLNTVLVASVMTEGGHYAVDLPGGLAAAAVTVYATRGIISYCKRTGSVGAGLSKPGQAAGAPDAVAPRTVM